MEDNGRGCLTVILMILVCLAFPVVGKLVDHANMRALEKYGREQFLEKDLQVYVSSKAKASGISDLQAEARVYSLYSREHPFYYDRSTRTLNMECHITFYSDEIDRYYTQTEDSPNARKLKGMLASLFNSCKWEEYTYTCEKGTVKVSVPGAGVFWSFFVYSGAGHVYEVDVDDYITLKIDGKWVVFEKR